jgi:chemotaxis protein CheD
MVDRQWVKAGKRIVLHPGEYHVTRESMMLSTLLGSCVSVCLYDPVQRVMGMNHFLLASRRHNQHLPLLVSEAGRYGIHAMELLINGLLRQGAKRSNLRAKAFGGGNVLGRDCPQKNDFMCIGDVNVRFVKEFLREDGIPLLASDLGGDVGRQIHFVGDDFSVYVRKIQRAESSQVIKEEKEYLRCSVNQHAAEKTRVDYW